MACLSRLHFDLPRIFSSFNAYLLSSADLACKKSLTLAIIVCYIFASTRNLKISWFALNLYAIFFSVLAAIVTFLLRPPAKNNYLKLTPALVLPGFSLMQPNLISRALLLVYSSQCRIKCVAFGEAAVLQTYFFLLPSEMSELPYADYIWYLSYMGQTWQGSCAVEVEVEAELSQEQLALSL